MKIAELIRNKKAEEEMYVGYVATDRKLLKVMVTESYERSLDPDNDYNTPATDFEAMARVAREIDTYNAILRIIRRDLRNIECDYVPNIPAIYPVEGEGLP